MSGWLSSCAAAPASSETRAVFSASSSRCRALLSSASRLVLFALPAMILSHRPGFQIRQIWYLSVASQVLQMCFNLLLLRRELGRKLRFEEVPIAGPA